MATGEHALFGGDQQVFTMGGGRGWLSPRGKSNFGNARRAGRNASWGMRGKYRLESAHRVSQKHCVQAGCYLSDNPGDRLGSCGRIISPV